jgi:IclR family transcriptional regulator, acetate operon repressor
MHQIPEARGRDYAVNSSENRANVCAVGAAVAESSGNPVAAVAVSMPDIRFGPSRVPEWST